MSRNSDAILELYKDNVLYLFSPSEKVNWQNFKHRHYTCCNNRNFTYHITDYGSLQLVEIECDKCHEKVNLNKVY